MADLSDVMADILAANIKTLRERLGLNQTDFADEVGTSQGTVSRWEKGAKPEFDHVVKLAGMAGMSVPAFTEQLLSQDRQAPVSFQAGVLFLPVQLPSEEALTTMFAGLLETMPANVELPALAQELARLLPNALAETVSHSQAGTEPPDQPRPPRGAAGAMIISGPARPR